MDFRTTPRGTISSLAETLPNARSIRVENAFARSEGGCELVLTIVDDDDPVAAVLEEDRSVTVLDLQRGDGTDMFHAFVIVGEGGPVVLEALLSKEAIPREIRVANGDVSVSATLRDWDHLKELGDEFERAFGRFDLRAVKETDRPGFPFGGARLTRVIEDEMGEEQLELLELAYERGFFELPRRASESDLADELGVSQSTVSERLRSAQQTLLGTVLAQG
ncbi:MAG: helix-turn-helix domain-containing protein [Halosimplex sp.]